MRDTILTFKRYEKKYLLSAEATTGCVIPVDGGRHLL